MSTVLPHPERGLKQFASPHGARPEAQNQRVVLGLEAIAKARELTHSVRVRGYFELNRHTARFLCQNLPYFV